MQIAPIKLTKLPPNKHRKQRENLWKATSHQRHCLLQKRRKTTESNLGQHLEKAFGYLRPSACLGTQATRSANLTGGVMVRSNDWLTAGQRYPSVGRRGHRGRPKCGSTGLQNPCQGRRHVTYQLHKRHFEHLSMSNVPPQTVWNATKHWLLPLCFALKIKMLLRSVVCVQHKKKK